MTVIALTLMIFLVTLGLLVSAIYFFVEAPAARKKLRARVAAIQQSSVNPVAEMGMGLMREEVMRQVPAFSRFLLQVPLLTKLEIFIQQSAMTISVPMLLLISAAIFVFVLLVGLLTFVPALLILALAAFVATIPFAVVGFKRQRRFSKFEELFPDAIDMLARAVRAGHAFTTALELIAQEMPEPLAGEIRLTYEQQNFGMPIKEALHNLSVRMPLSDVRFFVSALQIQRETGGNLAEILDNLSHVIRERFKIKRQVRVHTAQGRLTLYLLMGLTPGFALLMYFRNPKYIARLFTDPLGQRAIAFAVLLQIVGYFLIRKIIRIKI